MSSPKQRKDEYLTALHDTGSVPLAMKALEPPVPFRELNRWRQDKDFWGKEAKYAGRQAVLPEMDRATQRIIYLDALREYEGNTSAARELAGLKVSDLKTLRENPEFKDAEDEVFARIGDEIEQAVLAGAKSGKDLAHSLKVLGKLRKEQWGEEPKKIDHRHSGAISIKPLEEQIAELEADDGLDLLQPPG
jgi:hypothetical protein